MLQKTTVHALILLTTLCIIFFWVMDPVLSNYSLQLTGILLLFLIFAHRLHKPSAFRTVESVVSTIAVILITTATGGISSPFFFLNHFLLFELSLLLEPQVPIILSLGLIVFYLYSHQTDQSPMAIITLLSFPIMTPLAYYFGKIYRKEENQKKELKNLKNKVEELEDEVVEEELRINKSANQQINQSTNNIVTGK
jgi:hypothetical protein